MPNRREEIINIAREIFASGGFRSTTMRDIADACGLLAGSLYSHFKSKNEILQLILTPFYDRLIPAQEEASRIPGSGAERVEAMIRAVFPILFEYGEEMTIMHYNWFDLVTIDEFEPLMERSQYALVLWSEAINDGIQDGSMRRGVDADIAVRALTSSMFGVIDPKRYESLPSPVSKTGFDGLQEEFISLIMSGMGASRMSEGHTLIASKDR